MRLAFALLLAAVAPPAAAHRSRSFQVGAVVVRSARIRAGAARIQLTAAQPVAVSIDSAAPRLAAGDVALPPGTIRVTLQY